MILLLTFLTGFMVIEGPRFDFTISFGNLLTMVAVAAALYAAFIRQGGKIDATNSDIEVIKEWIKVHQAMADKRDELGKKLELATVKLVDAVEYLSKQADYLIKDNRARDDRERDKLERSKEDREREDRERKRGR